jgi:hypothetical protein
VRRWTEIFTLCELEDLWIFSATDMDFGKKTGLSGAEI